MDVYEIGCVTELSPFPKSFGKKNIRRAKDPCPAEVATFGDVLSLRCCGKLYRCLSLLSFCLKST